MSRTPTYVVWTSMNQRCSDENHSAFRDYGGRGIRVCERWRDSFENFLADMGERPSLEHSIDRLDNDGNYEPGNCRWATTKQQGRNKRTSHFIVVDGVRATVAEWAERVGMNPSTLLGRIRSGMPPEDAMRRPVSPPGGPRGTARGEETFAGLLPFAWHVACCYTRSGTGSRGGANHILVREDVWIGRLRRRRGETLCEIRAAGTSAVQRVTCVHCGLVAARLAVSDGQSWSLPPEPQGTQL